MRNLKFCILLFSVLLPDNAFSEEITVTAENLKGIITESAFKAAKTTFDISIYKNDEPRGEFQGVSAFKAPDRFTFKIFGPLGLTIFDAIGTDNILQLYIPSNDELYQGNLPQDTWLIFGILDNSCQYAMEETAEGYILYLLKAETRNEKQETRIINNSSLVTEPALSLSKGHSSLSKEDSLSIRAKFYFDKKELKHRRIDILQDGRTQFRVEINEFRHNFPLHMTFYFPSGITIVIKNKEIKLDEIPSEELFFLKDTEGREVKELKAITGKKSL
ncbi:MAG: hypothetical protein AABY44_01440 [Nitrospirota bacterium]